MGQKFTIEAPDIYLQAPGTALNLYIHSNKPIPRTTSLATIFHDIDTSGDGNISPTELGHYLQQRDIVVLSNQKLMDMFNVADGNHNYHISFHEFTQVMRRVELDLTRGSSFSKSSSTSSTTAGNTKWKQFFTEIRDELHPSFEIRLYEMHPGLGAKMVAAKPVCGTGITSITVSMSTGFQSNKKYYVSLFQIKNNFELARTKTITCHDHVSVVLSRATKRMKQEKVKQQEMARFQHEKEKYMEREKQRLMKEENIRRAATHRLAKEEASKLDVLRHRNTTRLLHDLFCQIDTNRNDQISFIELQSFVSKHWPAGSGGGGSSSSSSNNNNMSGNKRTRDSNLITITDEEAHAQEKEALIRTELVEMFRAADIDHSGYINFGEFQRVVVLAGNNEIRNRKWKEMYMGFSNSIRPVRVRYRR